jgi:hypothetical protein
MYLLADVPQNAEGAGGRRGKAGPWLVRVKFVYRSYVRVMLRRSRWVISIRLSRMIMVPSAEVISDNESICRHYAGTSTISYCEVRQSWFYEF